MLKWIFAAVAAVVLIFAIVVALQPSDFKVERSATMRGVSVHFAPSGRSVILIGHVFFFSTFIVNAIDWPSGDQFTFDGDSSTWVICDVAPSASM